MVQFQLYSKLYRIPGLGQVSIRNPGMGQSKPQETKDPPRQVSLSRDCEDQFPKTQLPTLHQLVKVGQTCVPGQITVTRGTVTKLSHRCKYTCHYTCHPHTDIYGHANPIPTFMLVSRFSCACFDFH